MYLHTEQQYAMLRYPQKPYDDSSVSLFVTQVILGRTAMVDCACVFGIA